MNLSSPLPANAWYNRVRERITTLWFIKSIGSLGWIAAFFVGYFWVLHHPMADVTVMPLTAIDRMVPFRPEALLLYASLWVYVSIVPALLKNFRELSSYGVATLALSAIGLGIFLAWPTAVPQFEVDMTRHPSISVLRGVDRAGNACPSLHVAFAIFTGIWMDRVLREMQATRVVLVLNWLWCLGIVYSTIATRQHVFLDVIAGSILGAIIAALHLAALGWYEQRATQTLARRSIERVRGA